MAVGRGRNLVGRIENYPRILRPSAKAGLDITNDSRLQYCGDDFSWMYEQEEMEALGAKKSKCIENPIWR